MYRSTLDGMSLQKLVDSRPTVDQDLDQVLIECQPRCQSSKDRVSIEGIDQHLTADALITHDPTGLTR